ncbi:homoserine/homoserine lactone efflux protein [Vibrio ishigakensis]|uniref:Homoserine/homoserine lactone efflux protein n=1 Tax=Vibrio ishigakensis TaxID=1481914 RepID=A0A0B8NP11_9VIBR|nr:homoserine/homoserine lactone efflux protein [Vibrio ishigakensis]GAM56330.1 homoserine/homoserine lactone efflux protein [Vibrio ishigakensis]
MELKIWLAYVATAIIFSLAPGSGTVNSISNGINYGMRNSLSAILGLQLGLAFHIVLVGAGLGAIVAKSATAFTVLKWVGVVYLIWLGIQKWRDSSGFALNQGAVDISRTKLLKQAVFINLTNPKSIVFLVALFPQFLNPSAPQLPQLLILGVTTIVIDGIVMVGYTGLAAQMGKYVRSNSVVGKLNKMFGSMFVGCGLLLASAKA